MGETMPDDDVKNLEDLADEGKAIMHDVPADEDEGNPEDTSVPQDEDSGHSAEAHALLARGTTGL